MARDPLKISLSSGVTPEVARSFADIVKHHNALVQSSENMWAMVLSIRKELIELINQKFDQLLTHVRGDDRRRNGDDLGDLFESYDADKTPHGGIRLPAPAVMDFQIMVHGLRDQIAALERVAAETEHDKQVAKGVAEKMQADEKTRLEKAGRVRAWIPIIITIIVTVAGALGALIHSAVSYGQHVH